MWQYYNIYESLEKTIIKHVKPSAIAVSLGATVSPKLGCLLKQVGDGLAVKGNEKATCNYHC